MHIFVSILLGTILARTFAQNISARNFNSVCGQVFTEKHFIVESPRYPSNYPANFECSYLVKGPSCPTTFELEFLDFNVESSLGCSKDRLEVDDQDAICGTRSDKKRYFSRKGSLILRFVSDEEGTGRGYRILVSRSECQNIPLTIPPTPPTTPKWYTTNSDVEYTTTSRPSNWVKCCQSSYTSKQFALTSPNFPTSMTTPTDCLYQIYKSNSNICRLRLVFRFFYLGSNPSCVNGFVEIDGRQICGCRNQLQLVSTFDSDKPKIVRFVSRGRETMSYTGFVAEVIQDECPKKYVPEQNFNKDEISRVVPQTGAVIEKLRLIGENTEVIPRERQVYRHVYFYASPEYNTARRDREEADYVDTNNLGANNINNYCLNWNRFQLNQMSPSTLPVCKINQGNVVEKKCVELRQPRGFLKTPGYPFYYPPNTNLCYRFYKQQGYCSVRIYMKDFNLEDSVSCQKDYLTTSNQQRYCRNDLINTISTIDLRHKQSEEISFVSDGFYCGRGFFGVYEQIPCDNYPSPPPMLPCSRTIQEEAFTLEVYDYNGPMCLFTIKRNTENVCSVRLYFEKFDLSCASESLIIDGTMYCGRLTGQSVSIDIADKDAVIIYKKKSPDSGISGLRFRINGDSDECTYLEVPPERLFRTKPLNTTSLENSKEFLLQISESLRNVCGVVTNITRVQLPETFCDLLMKADKNVTDCLPLTQNSLIVPIGSQKIELKIRDVEKTEQVDFQEVDCDHLRRK